MFEWLEVNFQGIGALFSIGAITWAAVHYINLQSKEVKQKRFETYHLLIRNFFEPLPNQEKPLLDRQIAIVFEMRNFPEYYEISLRMLEGLLPEWDKKQEWSRLAAETKSTIKYIKDKQIFLQSFRIYRGNWRLSKID